MSKNNKKHKTNKTVVVCFEERAARRGGGGIEKKGRGEHVMCHKHKSRVLPCWSLAVDEAQDGPAHAAGGIRSKTPGTWRAQ